MQSYIHILNSCKVNSLRKYCCMIISKTHQDLCEVSYSTVAGCNDAVFYSANCLVCEHQLQKIKLKGFAVTMNACMSLTFSFEYCSLCMQSHQTIICLNVGDSNCNKSYVHAFACVHSILKTLLLTNHHETVHSSEEFCMRY